jgi:hypothetical protein
MNWRMMKRLAAISILLCAGLILGCSDSTTPTYGTLKLYTAINPVSRIAEDTDGVAILIDAAAAVRVGALGDSVIRSAIAVGEHTVEVRDVRETCTLHFPNPFTIRVSRDSTSAAILFGLCQ